MKLAELLDATGASQVCGSAECEISGIAYDSRKVRAGELFFALPGLKHDGRAFAAQALERGAAAVVCERALDQPGATTVQVRDARLAMASAACRFHGHPSRGMKVVAVTGTNGKTTTTYMLESVFRAAGLRAGVIGTTGIRIDGESRPSTFTTPEAPELQGALAEMRDRGVQAVAIEASSHALAQRRTWGLECDACVFTNLTQDHLDFHGTMDAYLDAKLMLFDGRNGSTTKRAVAVVNADDPSLPRVLAAAQAGGMPSLNFGLDGDAPAGVPIDVSVGRLEAGSAGLALHLTVQLPAALRPPGPRNSLNPVEGEKTFHLPMIGRFNASNAAAAYGAAMALELRAEAIVTGLECVTTVPGRLERIEERQPFLVVVDYAHTPDALERALSACRGHARGRVLLVFGCGGDRDRGKRPIMGGIAGRGADLSWITNDNPRGEDPDAIAREIAAGMTREARIVPDRRTAITAAIDAARPGDVVLIAGKGHETTQTIGDRVLPFDDRDVARSALRARAGSGR